MEDNRKIKEGYSKIDQEHSQIKEGYSKIDQEHSQIKEAYSKIDQEHSQINEAYSKIDQEHSQIKEANYLLQERMKIVEKRMDDLESLVMKNNINIDLFANRDNIKTILLLSYV